MFVHVHISLSFSFFLALIVVIMSFSTFSLVRALHSPSMQQWKRFLSLGKSSDRIYRIRNESLNANANDEPEQPTKPKTKQPLLRSKLLKNLKTAGSGSAMMNTNELVNTRVSDKVGSSSSSSSSRKTTGVNSPSNAKSGGMKMEAQTTSTEGIDDKTESDRPFTLPPGHTPLTNQSLLTPTIPTLLYSTLIFIYTLDDISGLFRPKQSLGQNFLSDQNYVLKICDAFSDRSEGGHRVVEIGPGPGALTRVLYPRYPKMTAIEIDQRAVAFLGEKLPGLQVQHLDVLAADWPQMAVDRGGPIRIIANLPYYIVSQVLFSLADSHKAIEVAVVTMQLEVAERITAKPSTKQYGIPSVVFQLYGEPKINFKIPPTVFFPKPNVDSALLTLDFTKPHPELHKVDGDQLRRVLTAAFQQRRKMMRQSLKDLLRQEQIDLPARWATLRPEQLTPVEFIHLTADLFGEQKPGLEQATEGTKSWYESRHIWRKALFGGSGGNDSGVEEVSAFGEEGGEMGEEGFRS